MSIKEAYSSEDGPFTSQQIIPLDFDSVVDAVPESHLWPLSDEIRMDALVHEKGSSVPVIDLMDPNAVELIGNACRTWGVFQVTNHGVPLELLEKVESEARRLFCLPTEEKRKVSRLPGGATGYGSARVSPFFSKRMWHEGFTIMGSCVDDAKVLWPHDYQSFCDTMEDYQKKIKPLGYQLLLLILKSLDLTQEEMNWAASAFDSQGALQLNSYPCCPNPSRTIGLVPHTDPLLLTILHQSNINGLQIFHEGMGWTSVSPVEGALVVNVSDLLHIYSNASFPAAYHRAVVNQSGHRISVAYSFAPPFESVVAPFSKFEKQQFRSLSVKEYISLKYKHPHDSLSLIRI